jgi:hypothetical protein
MKPDTAFSQLDAKGYAELLEVRLREFNHPDESRKLAAMDLFDRTIMQWLPANEWLRIFFDGLSPQAQIHFRNGIDLMIQHARPDNFPALALEELLVLAADVGAYGAVPAMVRLVADGGEWAHIRPGPVGVILGVLKRLKAKDEGYGQACQLSASDTLEDSLVFDAFEVLIRSRPEEWGNAWLMLEAKFCRALKYGPQLSVEKPSEWFSSRVRDLVQRCFSLFSPWTLLKGINIISAHQGKKLHSLLSITSPLGILWCELISATDCPFDFILGDSGTDPSYRLVNLRLKCEPNIIVSNRNFIWIENWQTNSKPRRFVQLMSSINQFLPRLVSEDFDNGMIVAAQTDHRALVELAS